MSDKSTTPEVTRTRDEKSASRLFSASERAFLDRVRRIEAESADAGALSSSINREVLKALTEVDRPKSDVVEHKSVVSRAAAVDIRQAVSARAAHVVAVGGRGGQKVTPIGLHTGMNRSWESRWVVVNPSFSRLLQDDLKLRSWLKEQLSAAGVSRIIIERPHKKCRVTIYAACPGFVIGRRGAKLEKLRAAVSARTHCDTYFNIVEVAKPEIDAQLIAETLAGHLEMRVAFRRALKRVVQSAVRLGVKGIRINVSGRLGGASIARMEWYREGRVPLHTLRADIDYGFIQAGTSSGIVGIKVWVFKGETLAQDPTARTERWLGAAADLFREEGGSDGPSRGRGPRRGRER